jgi:hypothetical protein
VIFKKGKLLRRVKEERIVPDFIKEVRLLASIYEKDKNDVRQ